MIVNYLSQHTQHFKTLYISTSVNLISALLYLFLPFTHTWFETSAIYWNQKKNLILNILLINK